jgi:hypothetical protein
MSDKLLTASSGILIMLILLSMAFAGQDQISPVPAGQAAIATLPEGSRDACSWQPGYPHKMHFPQLPDEAGWDVNATQPVVLADDFMCMETGAIKEFHWWGSWKHGIEGQILYFVLSIHADIPADPPGIPYSRPGVTLWEREVAFFEAIPFDPPSMEGWYDPTTGEVIDNDHQAYFQYNVCLESEDWFWQDSGTIYWLNISAVVADPVGTQWGWKSTNYHWNDDAVWAFWGELNWIDIWEPYDFTLDTNEFWVEFGDDGVPIDGGGIGYYDDGTSFNGWYFYPNTDWWNIWFYDHPFNPNGYKNMDIYFEWYPTDPYYWIEVTANWSTPDWPANSPPPIPPLTPAEENLYIEREYLELYPPGWQNFGVLVPDYCPEWVSMDFMGQNFIIEGGFIIHECQGQRSLDLAFVISSGTCCDQPGDANDNGAVNIIDITYLIAYLYQGGPPPPCMYEGDANGDCTINILDISYLISYLYMGGPAPICARSCPGW